MEIKRLILPIEYKSLPDSVITDVDTASGVIVAYASSFNTVDNGRDEVIPGAFAKTIVERGPKGKNQIKHIKQHNKDFPIGYVQHIEEDAFGLKFETKATVGVPYVDDMLKFYAAKVYNEHSFGYEVMKYNFVENPKDENDYKFQLTELKLYEVSTVLWGMNENTPFIGFKSNDLTLLKKEFDEKISKILQGLRIPGLTDEAYKALETQHAQIILKYTEIDSLIKKQPDSAKTTEENEPTEAEKRLKEASDKEEQQKINQILINLKNTFK